MGKAKIIGAVPAILPAVSNAVILSRKAGMVPEMCAKNAGISTTMLRQWLERGTADIEAGAKTEYAKFAREFDRAEGEFIGHNLSVIAKAAAKGSWQASAWLLERTRPDLFAESKRLDVSGSGDAPQVVIDAPQEVEVGDGTDKHE
jgi:hypothetical protein